MTAKEMEDLLAVTEQLRTVTRERDEALKLAYIGEHRFPDLTWKARCAEVEQERDGLRVACEQEMESVHARLLALLQRAEEAERKIRAKEATMASLRVWMTEYPNDKYTGTWWVQELDRLLAREK